MTLPPTNPPSSQGTLAELGRHYEMFAEERDRLFPAHPAAPPALDRIDAVLNRLSYWSGVFSMFGQAARASEQNQDYDLPYHLLSVQHEILSLQSIYGQMKTAALVPRPAPVAQPAAPQAAPAPPAPAVMPKDPLYEDRRIREVIRTNQNKSFRLCAIDAPLAVERCALLRCLGGRRRRLRSHSSVMRTQRQNLDAAISRWRTVWYRTSPRTIATCVVRVSAADRSCRRRRLTHRQFAHWRI